MTITSLEEYTKIFHRQATQSTSLEVKAHGEVYTPLSLVSKMLDKLPSHVWSNPNLKWFEPACGLAPFLFLSYQRLMIGLEPTFTDSSQRSRHIIETMFYFNELQEKNLKQIKQLFNSASYKLNIFEGSFFDITPSTFKLIKADIIVGNPPYNSPGSISTGNIIWNKFVKEVFTQDLLAPNGFLLFVHPPLWRKPVTARSPVHGLYALLTQQHQLLYLDINDIDAGKKVFGCGTRYDWYLVKNKVPYTTTVVRCERGELHTLKLEEWPWLPNTEFDLIGRLMGGSSGDLQKVIYSRSIYGADKSWVSKEKKGVYLYPLVHSTVKKGVVMMYSSVKVENDGMFGVSKVIIGESGIGEPVIDVSGEYGLTHNCFGLGVRDGDDAEELVRFLQSEVFERVMRGCCWSVFRLDHGVFSSLREGFWRLL